MMKQYKYGPSIKKRGTGFSQLRAKYPAEVTEPGPGKDLLLQNRALQSTDQFNKLEDSTCRSTDEPDALTAPSKFMVLKNTFFKSPATDGRRPSSQLPVLDVSRLQQSNMMEFPNELNDGGEVKKHQRSHLVGGPKQPKYTYYHQERLKHLFGPSARKHGFFSQMHEFDAGQKALNEPPHLADSDLGVFSDYKKEHNIEETLIDGVTDPTHEDGTISHARQKSGGGITFSHNNYQRYISQEGQSCFSGGPNSTVSRPMTRGQMLQTRGELSSQMARETQSS